MKIEIFLQGVSGNLVQAVNRLKIQTVEELKEIAKRGLCKKRGFGPSVIKEAYARFKECGMNVVPHPDDVEAMRILDARLTRAAMLRLHCGRSGEMVVVGGISIHEDKKITIALKPFSPSAESGFRKTCKELAGQSWNARFSFIGAEKGELIVCLDPL